MGTHHGRGPDEPFDPFTQGRSSRVDPDEFDPLWPGVPSAHRAPPPELDGLPRHDAARWGPAVADGRRALRLVRLADLVRLGHLRGRCALVGELAGLVVGRVWNVPLYELRIGRRAGRVTEGRVGDWLKARHDREALLSEFSESDLSADAAAVRLIRESWAEAVGFDELDALPLGALAIPEEVAADLFHVDDGKAAPSDAVAQVEASATPLAEVERLRRLKPSMHSDEIAAALLADQDLTLSPVESEASCEPAHDQPIDPASKAIVQPVAAQPEALPAVHVEAVSIVAHKLPGERWNDDHRLMLLKQHEYLQHPSGGGFKAYAAVAELAKVWRVSESNVKQALAKARKRREELASAAHARRLA